MLKNLSASSSEIFAISGESVHNASRNPWVCAGSFLL